MLVGTFTFANTEVMTNIDVNKVESSINVDNSELTMDVNNVESLINVDNPELTMDVTETSSCGFPVYYDDGGTGDWGGSGSFDYGFDCNSDSFWDDFFFMIGNVLPGWDSVIINH